MVRRQNELACKLWETTSKSVNLGTGPRRGTLPNSLTRFSEASYGNSGRYGRFFHVLKLYCDITKHHMTEGIAWQKALSQQTSPYCNQNNPLTDSCTPKIQISPAQKYTRDSISEHVKYSFPKTFYIIFILFFQKHLWLSFFY